eukprot:SAG22_NODE_2305_length_2736_cov_1.701934_3_plen_345_part_00
MIMALRSVHQLGFVHRDVKPANFAMGMRPGSIGVCYVIDFGLARKYTHTDGSHRAPRPEAGFRGPARYASLQAHRLEDLGRRDDLWSVVFVLHEWLAGSLPWSAIADRDVIKAMKTEWLDQCLCSPAAAGGGSSGGGGGGGGGGGSGPSPEGSAPRLLPDPVPAMARYLVTLDYADRPDYDYFCSLFDVGQPPALAAAAPSSPASSPTPPTSPTKMAADAVSRGASRAADAAALRPPPASPAGGTEGDVLGVEALPAPPPAPTVEAAAEPAEQPAPEPMVPVQPTLGDNIDGGLDDGAAAAAPANGAPAGDAIGRRRPVPPTAPPPRQGSAPHRQGSRPSRVLV